MSKKEKDESEEKEIILNPKEKSEKDKPEKEDKPEKDKPEKEDKPEKDKPKPKKTKKAKVTRLTKAAPALVEMLEQLLVSIMSGDMDRVDEDAKKAEELLKAIRGEEANQDLPYSPKALAFMTTLNDEETELELLEGEGEPEEVEEEPMRGTQDSVYGPGNPAVHP